MRGVPSPGTSRLSSVGRLVVTVGARRADIVAVDARRLDRHVVGVRDGEALRGHRRPAEIPVMLSAALGGIWMLHTKLPSVAAGTALPLTSNTWLGCIASVY